MKPRQDSADKRAGSGCMARLVGPLLLWLGGIGEVVEKLLEIDANLLKFELSGLLIIGGESVWGLEIGIVQRQKAFHELAELPLANPRNVSLNRETSTTNPVPVVIIELPEIHRVVFTGLRSKITQLRLERPTTVNGFAAPPKAMSEPEADESGKKAWKNALIKYVHSGLWVAPLITGLVLFVIGLLLGKFRVEIGWWMDRRIFRHNDEHVHHYQRRRASITWLGL